MSVVITKGSINKLKTIVVAIGCLPLMFVGMGAASANLVSNPSFETFAGTFGSDGGRQLTTGVATLTGWAITGGEIAIAKNLVGWRVIVGDFEREDVIHFDFVGK